MVSGWFKGEFTALGEPWLEHDERYRRSEEFIRALRGIWTEDHFNLRGDFYRINDYNLKPKPVQTPHPEIFQGGNSHAARAMAGAGLRLVLHERQHAGRRARADRRDPGATPPSIPGPPGATSGSALNAFIIARDTEAEAQDVLREIIRRPTSRRCTASARRSSRPARPPGAARGCGRSRTSRISSSTTTASRPASSARPSRSPRRIVAYKAEGVNLILGGFLHYLEEVEYFGKRVLPLVRELEAEQAGRRAA